MTGTPAPNEGNTPEPDQPEATPVAGPFADTGRRSGKRSRIRALLASESVRGAMKLTGGSGAAQLITIAAAPILTRLYGPSDFGALALFTSVSAILIVVAAGRYEMAIMLPDDEEEATAVTGVALVLTTATALLTMIGAGILYLAYPPVSESALGMWVFLIPLTVLMGGWSATFVAFATRHGEFGTVATMGVLRQAVGAAASISLGLMKVGAGGLLLGGFLSVSAANLRLGRPVIRDLRSYRPTRSQLRESARRYSKFPRLTLPAGMLNTAAISGLPILIGALFGAATLGVWSLTQRILAMPSALVGQAASETYYRRAVQLRHSPKQALRLFDKTVLALAALSIVPFILIGVFGDWLFGFVFGPEWTEAGVYARIMLPWLWVKFISSPVSRTIWVYEKNTLDAPIQAVLLAAVVLSAALALVFDLPFTTFLAILSFLTAGNYLFVILISRRFIRQTGQDTEPTTQ